MSTTTSASETSAPEYKDLAGNDIRVGDYVVYSALWDRSAVLKFGKVERLAEREANWYRKKPEATIRVRTVDRHTEWRDGKPLKEYWMLQKQGQETTLGFLNRMLVIGSEHVPPDALRVLNMPKPAKHKCTLFDCKACRGEG